ncbi:hypothetical protein GWZ95_05350 [Escherichia coli]|nr:hypothetical protein [Escherichia coli]
MTVSFSNIPSNLRVPLFYVEVDNSMANSATETQRTLLIGQMTAEGTATAGTAYRCSSASTAPAASHGQHEEQDESFFT